MAVFSNLQVLSRDEVEEIHRASLDILTVAGVRIPHDEALDLFARAGARVDCDAKIVRIPGKLAEDCLRTCGKRFTLAGRDPKKQARFGYGSRNYNTISGEATWFDHRTGERRYPGRSDVACAARVADALPHITIAGAMADPHELPVKTRCIEVAATLIKNTTKPIGLWFHDRASTRYLVELFEAVAGGKEQLAASPIAYPFLEPISPLSFTFNGVDLLFETGKIPLPVPIGPMAQLGATAPGTLAGTLAQENAEILAGICVTQLIREGTPVCYGGIPHALDMRTMQMIFSGPEQALMAVAMVQMGKRYGLPVYINVGLTDSKVPDGQAGMECGVTLLAGVLAGADIYGHMGICGVDQAASLPMLILQHEIISFVERLASGFAVNDDTLAVGVIESTGPGGNYLAHEHTVSHFRNELWFPSLLDRTFFEQWDGSGRKRLEDRAMEHLDAILEKHTVEPVEEKLEEEIDRIVRSARKDLLL